MDTPSQIFCSLSAARHSSLPFCFQLATRYSRLHFPTHVVSFAAPDEGRAERRWRSDACEAPVSARHDRRAVASLDRKAVTAALRSLRTTGERGSRSISQTEQAQSARGVLRSQGRGRSFRRSAWDFWPGPVLAVVRHSLRDRARNLICRTGHRYPEEQVSRTSPARPLTASGDTTTSLRLAETPPEAPLRKRGYTICSTDRSRVQDSSSLHGRFFGSARNPAMPSSLGVGTSGGLSAPLNSHSSGGG